MGMKKKLACEVNCIKFRNRVKVLSSSILVSSDCNLSQQYAMTTNMLKTLNLKWYIKGKEPHTFIKSESVDIIFKWRHNLSIMIILRLHFNRVYSHQMCSSQTLE